MLNKFRSATFLIVLLLISVPFVFAYYYPGEGYTFGGFFINPLDGNTYLAKMYQGWQGAWKITLPYTAEPGEGAYLFLYYLFLGHVSRLLNLPIPSTFHAARIINAILLLLALNRFYSTIFIQRRTAYLAFILATLGSGIGWIASLVGYLSVDMWVAEGYPFLASFTSAHFPLAIAIMVFLLTPRTTLLFNLRPLSILAYSALGFILATISPFSLILVAIISAGQAIWEWLPVKFSWFPANKVDENSITPDSHPLRNLQWVAWTVIGGFPVVAYQLWISRVHPVLSIWNQQNLTPTPPAWDLIIALSPTLLLAGVGSWFSVKRRNPADRLLLTWAGTSLVLMYIPTSLQLRFMIGLFVPLAGLAAWGIECLAGASQRKYRNLVAALFIFSLPTILFLLLVAFTSVKLHHPLMYLTQGEAKALSWIKSNTPQDTLILAAPETGLYIPAHTGRRVIYGHPFETVQADKEREMVTQVFQSGWSDGDTRAFLNNRGVDYIFYGPRERSLGTNDYIHGLKVVYRGDGVTIYAVEDR